MCISFGTSRTKVLTSEMSLAQLHIYNEWKKTKVLKKKDLIEKMVAKYRFLEDEIRTKKVAELKQLVEQHLLAQEEELVEGYQKELNKVTIPIPPLLANFSNVQQTHFQTHQSPRKKMKKAQKSLKMVKMIWRRKFFPPSSLWKGQISTYFIYKEP